MKARNLPPRHLFLLLLLPIAWSAGARGATSHAPVTPLPKLEKNAELALSTGPRSEEERALLWKQSREFIDQRNWKEADARLERLLFRYPEHPERVEALALRGAVLLKLDRLKDAQPVLREAWQTGEKTPHWGLTAGELLARAALKDARITQAVLLSQELRYRAEQALRQATSKKGADPELASLGRRNRAASWLIEAHARAAQARITRVDGLLRTYRTEERNADARGNFEGLEAEADSLAISVRRDACTRTFDRKLSGEAAALKALDQAFLCEAEVLASIVAEFDSTNTAITVKPVPAPLPFAFPSETDWLESTLVDESRQLGRLAAFCGDPRVAAPSTATTAEERARFHEELKDETIERCRREALSLLRLVSESASLRPRLQGMIETGFSPLAQKGATGHAAAKGTVHP